MASRRNAREAAQLRFFIDNFGESDSDSDFLGFESDEDYEYAVESGDSDTNSESDTCEEEPGGEENGGDSSSGWTSVISDQTIGEFVLDSGPNLPRNLNVAEASPLKYFSLFFQDEVYDKIAAETNAYAVLCARESGQPDKYWMPTDGEEMKAFIGLSLLMGVNPKREYADYWSADPFLGVVGFQRVMTLNRYEKLCQYLHCNHAAARIDKNDPRYHPIAKVAPIVDMVRQKFKMYYTHSRDISIDEAMKGYKGRTELRMYMPNKPEKFGIKFWARCDGRTAYMSDFQLYSGKRDNTPIQKVHGLGYRVIHEMTRDLVGLNHCVYFDRFFSSVVLLEHLLSDHIYACGTIMNTKKGVPPAMKDKKQLKRQVPNRGDSISFQQNNITVTAWNDNNVVVLAHSCLAHPGEMFTCERQVGRQKLTVQQPHAIHRYNQHMNGVDVHDQLRKKYAASRASKKYWKYILWFVIDCCRVNAWLLYKLTSTRRLERKRRYVQKDFILELGKELVNDFSSRKRAAIRECGTPIDIDLSKRKMTHIFERLPGKHRRCKSCYKNERRHETVYGCSTCNTHMCNDCFRQLHPSED